MNNAKLTVGFGANTAEFDAAIGKTVKSLDKFGKKAKDANEKAGKAGEAGAKGLNKISSAAAAVNGRFAGISGAVTAAATAMAGVVATVGAAGSALWKVSSAADAAAQDMQKLKNIINATGGAVGLTADEIDSFIKDLSRNTAAARSEIKLAANVLLGFERVTGDTFKKVLTLSQDLAAQGFGDIADNAQTLGEALEDPAGAIESLAERGIIFSESQKEVVKRMAETNRVAEAQAIILGQIEQKVAGVGTAGGMAQGLKVLGESIGDFAVAIGNSLGQSQTFVQLLDRMATGFQVLSEMIDPSPLQEAEDASRAASEAYAEAYERLQSISKIGRNYGGDDAVLAAQQELAAARLVMIAADEKVGALRKEIKADQERAKAMADARARENEARRVAAENAKLRQEATLEFQKRLDAMKLEGEMLKTNTSLEKLNAEIKYGSLKGISEAQAEELRRQLAINEALAAQASLREASAKAALMGANEGPQTQGALNDEARASAQEYFDWFNKSEEQRRQMSNDAESAITQFKQASTATQVGIVSDGLAQMSSALGTHSKKMFEINKIAATASAIVNTAQGVTKALATLPPPLSFAVAAATAAAGMAQIRAIQSQQFGGGGGVPSPGGGAGAPSAAAVAEPESARRYIRVEGIEAGSLFDAKSVRALIRQIGEELGDGVVLST